MLCYAMLHSVLLYDMFWSVLLRSMLLCSALLCYCRGLFLDLFSALLCSVLLFFFSLPCSPRVFSFILCISFLLYRLVSFCILSYHVLPVLVFNCLIVYFIVHSYPILDHPVVILAYRMLFMLPYLIL